MVTFSPIVQGLRSQGRTHPEWVNWPTLTKWCQLHYLRLEIGSCPEELVWAVHIHREKLFHLVTVLNPESFQRLQYFFLVEELVVCVLN